MAGADVPAPETRGDHSRAPGAEIEVHDVGSTLPAPAREQECASAGQCVGKAEEELRLCGIHACHHLGRATIGPNAHDGPAKARDVVEPPVVAPASPVADRGIRYERP